ncbi:MAG: hypothetical protein JSS43_21085 [Proteobacteria bacterium]|nr:hypothetical protein [Pseudomonadota bacterium]
MAYEALDRIGEANAQDIIDRVVQDAKGGDMRAAEIILRRAWPERKGRAVTIDLPQMVDADGVIAALAAVTRAVATGALTPDEGQALVGLLEAQRRAVETIDLAKRIEALERAKETGR